MDIKSKTCDIRTWKIFISRHILHQHWYTSPIALPVRRIPQHRSLLTFVSATSAPPFQPLRHLRNVCHQAVNGFTRQTLPTVNREHFFMNILCTESFCPQKMHKRTLPFGGTLLKHGRHFAYRNRLLNISMRICCLHCNEAGLCCHLVIHILRPLQVFYFHLWPISWLSLVFRELIYLVNETLHTFFKV
jgi:hypothetical protein